VESEEGQCPDGYAYCLTDVGFDRINSKLDELDACGQERTACEFHLAACQGDLDRCPQFAECECDEVTREVTPWWVWMLLGGTVALIPVGIGVGWYFGHK